MDEEEKGKISRQREKHYEVKSVKYKNSRIILKSGYLSEGLRGKRLSLTF